MMPNDFVITEFSNIYEASNAKGKILELKNRYCSCFIVTLSGSIKFSYSGGSVIADGNHPIFIPEGLSYKNECLEDAESLVFNFHTLKKYAAPATLSRVSHRVAVEIYEAIEKAVISDTDESRMTVLSKLYSLAADLFSASKEASFKDEIINKATEYIRSSYQQPSLTVAQVASECFVSDTYLRKLFVEKLNTTPFVYITEIRMNHARNLALEKISVKEIAATVGFSDIFQFSRAYKKHFGYPPSKTL